MSKGQDVLLLGLPPWHPPVGTSYDWMFVYSLQSNAIHHPPPPHPPPHHLHHPPPPLPLVGVVYQGHDVWLRARSHIGCIHTSCHQKLGQVRQPPPECDYPDFYTDYIYRQYEYVSVRAMRGADGAMQLST